MTARVIDIESARLMRALRRDYAVYRYHHALDGYKRATQLEGQPRDLETLRESMRAEAPVAPQAFPRTEQEPFPSSGPDSRGAAGASYCADCGAWLDPRKFVAYCPRARIGFCVRCAPGRLT